MDIKEDIVLTDNTPGSAIYGVVIRLFNVRESTVDVEVIEPGRANHVAGEILRNQSSNWYSESKFWEVIEPIKARKAEDILNEWL